MTIRVLIERSPRGSKRSTQIVCDGCGVTTGMVEGVELPELGARTGFKSHVGPFDRTRVGDAEIRDLCPTCSVAEGP